MTFESQVEIHDDHVHCHIKGKISSAEIISITQDIVNKCKQHNRSKVLVDLRKGGSDTSIAETFFMGSEELPSLTKGVLRKAAIIENEINDNMIFFETVALNRGHNVKFFTDLEKAKDWIKD